MDRSYFDLRLKRIYGWKMAQSRETIILRSWILNDFSFFFFLLITRINQYNIQDFINVYLARHSEQSIILFLFSDLLFDLYYTEERIVYDRKIARDAKRSFKMKFLYPVPSAQFDITETIGISYTMHNILNQCKQMMIFLFFI